jgi:hypothetical protein
MLVYQEHYEIASSREATQFPAKRGWRDGFQREPAPFLAFFAFAALADVLVQSPIPAAARHRRSD